MDFKRFLQGPSGKEEFPPREKGGSRPGTALGNQSKPTTTANSEAGTDWVSNKINPTHSQFGDTRDAVQDGKDSLHHDVLTKVRQTFLAADDDGSGRLLPEEFVRAFLGILQTEDGGDEEALTKLFCRIDANSDGTIDWDEFSTYMLLESQGSASIRELESAIHLVGPETCGISDSLHHKDLITNVSHVTLSNGADRFITCGKDGVVKVWNAKDMKHLRSIPTGKSWVTCCKLLPLTNKLAVSSFSRSLKIYDMQTYELCGQIPEIDYAPMAMDVWVPHRNKDVEMVVFGDGGGYVRLYELRINPMEEKNSSDRYIDIPKWKFHHHSDWVTSVCYVEDMNCVVAGSLDKLVSMTDAEERVPLKVLEGHTKGVTTVDWSPIYKFVCSGGQDRKIILWNPFSQKPLAQLLGHSSSVQQVLVNDKDNQIISLGSDKTVKVWDIRNHKCLQTIQDKQNYKVDDTLLAMTFDGKRKQLVTGNLEPKIWKQIITTSGSAGHRQPVTKVIYNDMFEEAVSGDHGGTISVWHVPTGKLRFRFYNAHQDKRVTAMNFDVAKRRLITGCENGEVKVWNFSSGSCLSTLKSSNREEVTSVVAVRGLLMRHFLVSGWDAKVTYFDDNGVRDVGPGRSLKGHKSDVLDMVLMENYPALMTACDDGEIWSWNIESGAPRRVMTASFKPDIAPNERAAEVIRFLHGKMKHVLVAVYADRFMRLWDAHSGVCIREVFTGHKLGETVMGVAIDSSNHRIATADSAGFIKMWDLSSFHIQGSEYVGEVTELCIWRGHRLQVSSLDWSEEKDSRELFLLSSSHDKEVRLWTETGVLVGIFGVSLWQLNNPSTWQAQEIQPLEEVDKFDIEMSRHRPDHVGMGRPSTAHLATNYSFMRDLLQDDSSASINAPSPRLNEAERTLQGQSRQYSLASATTPVDSRGRPISAAPSVARVLQASHMERLSRVGSVRRHVRQQSQLHNEPSKSGQGQEDVEDTVESDVSSHHDSDEDVPAALWLASFDASRKGRHTADHSSSIYQPRSGGGLNFPNTMGRKEGTVAHLMHISEPKQLPERPSTSVGTSRGK